MTADGPLDRRFWLGRTDPRPLAALRICLGLVLLFQLADLSRSFHALFTSDSFFPTRSASDPGAFGLFLLVDGGIGATLLLAAYAVALGAYTIGWQTRVASIAAWALCVSLHHRNPIYLSGGDWMAQLMLLWSIFADTGAVWSVDAYRTRRAPTLVFAAPLRVMQLHVALIYFITGRLKYIGTWSSGWGVYLSLDLRYFNRPPGSWMHAHPALCRFTNHAVLALELPFLFMAFFPFGNRFGQLAAAITNVGVQLGVMATMKVGAFTTLMFVVTVLFIPPFVWERTFGPIAGGGDDADPRPSARQWAVVSLFAFAIGLIAWDPFVGRRLPMPHALTSARVALGIDQPYALFDRFYQAPSWQASGVRPDGTTVDLIPIVAPGLAPNDDWLADVWVKAAFNLHNARDEDVGRFFCRAYIRARNETLSSVRVVLRSRLQSLPGMPANPIVTRVFHDGACP